MKVDFESCIFEEAGCVDGGLLRVSAFYFFEDGIVGALYSYLYACTSEETEVGYLFYGDMIGAGFDGDADASEGGGFILGLCFGKFFDVPAFLLFIDKARVE